MPVKTASSPRLDVSDPYMSVNDICNYLGVNRANVYRMMREGRLPYVLVGSRRRVLQSHVKAVIAEVG